jgi:hypothetical protein
VVPRYAQLPDFSTRHVEAKAVELPRIDVRPEKLQQAEPEHVAPKRVTMPEEPRRRCECQDREQRY